MICQPFQCTNDEFVAEWLGEQFLKNLLGFRTLSWEDIM